MSTEVLNNTPSLDTSIIPLQMDVTGCVEHPVTLLPVRGSPPASYTPTEECPQMERAPRCTPFGLTGSPRIGPHCEQCHSREVKPYEGKEQHVDRHRGTRIPRALPSMLSYLNKATSSGRVIGIRRLDDRVTPEHLNYHEVINVTTNKKSNKKTDFNNLELPPLPERAIKGLDHPWVSPNGESFHTVRLWEFPLLYVLLKHEVWVALSNSLRRVKNLAAFGRRWKISRSILANIRDNPNQSINVSNLRKLCYAYNFDFEWIEQSLRAVMFNFCGEKEKLNFPFTMNIHSWRALCHIAGDGNVHYRKKTKKSKSLYPDLRWTQWPRKGGIKLKKFPPKSQCHMRTLLERLSRFPGGTGYDVNYPKALTYTILGTMPGMKISELRTPRFIQFVLDLPLTYRDFKVQFLAAFAIDDGGIDQTINFFQSSLQKLELVMKLCDQLKYEYSNKEYLHERDGVWSFRLLLNGIRNFYNDLIEIQSRYANDKLLGLWHKSHLLRTIVENVSDKRLEDNKRAIAVYECILTILSDYKIRDTKQLRQHPKLQPLVKDYIDKIFRDRFQWLSKENFIQEVKKPDDGSYRPKKWVISPGRDLETLLKEFHKKYANRSHPLSYKRRFITVDMAKEAMARLRACGIKPNPTNTAREGRFSRRLFYERDDLRALFEEPEEIPDEQK